MSTTIPQNVESAAPDTHEISFMQPKVMEIIKIMDSAQQNGKQFSLATSEEFEFIWQRMDEDRDIATVVICLLLGYLMLDEHRDLKIIPNIQTDEEFDGKFRQLVDLMKFGTLRFDKHHPLLQRRDKVLSIPEKSDEEKEQVEKETSPFSFCTGKVDLPTNAPLTIERINMRSQLLTTLVYIVLHYDFDRLNVSLINMIQTVVRAREKLAKKAASKNENTEDPIHKIVNNFEDSDTRPERLSVVLLEYFLSHAVDNSSKTFSKILDKEPTSGVTTMLFHYFIQHLHHNSDSAIQVLNYLIYNTNAATISTHLKFVLFLFPKLHIPFSMVQKLKEFMVVIKDYLMEPLPLGGYVRRSLILCRNKMLFCLKNVRDRIRDKQKLVGTHVHVVVNPYSTYAKFFNSLMLQTSGHSDDTSLAYVKASIVVAAFKFYLSQEDSVSEDEQESISKLPVDLLVSYYESVDNFLVSVEEEDNSPDDSTPFFMTLYQKLMLEAKVFQSSASNSYNLNNNICGFSNNMITPVHYHVHELSFESQLSLEKSNLVNKIFPRSVCMETLSNIIGIEQDRIDDLAESEGNTNNGSPKTTINLMIAGGTGTIHRIVHSLHTIRAQRKVMRVNWNLYHLPLGANNDCVTSIATGDSLFSSLIYKPLVSLANLPIMFESPQAKSNHYDTTSTSNLDALSRPDARQSRGSIVLPSNRFMFTDRRLYDAPLDKAVLLEDKVIEFLTPHRYLRSIVDFYINNAQTPINQHVYNIQCLIYGVNKRETSSSTNTPSTPSETRGTSVQDMVSLVFASRVDIGVVPEAVVLKQKYEEDTVGARLAEIINHSGFPFSNKPFEVSYVPMAPSATTVLSSLVRQPIRAYQSLTIKSCSLPGDHGNFVRASDRWLEVTSEDSESIDRSRRFGDEYINSNHIGSITVDSIDRFHITVDGELYGPFHRTIAMQASGINHYNTFIISDELS